MADKFPAFQFYPADWRKDPGVQSLKWADRAVWFEIILLMHESPRRGVLLLPNEKPMTTAEISRVIGMPEKQLAKILDRIAAAGVSGVEERTGALVNRRMVRDEAIRTARTAAGHLGGNPNLVKQKPTTGLTDDGTKGQPEDNQAGKQKPTPSSSSSSSSSSSDLKPIVGFENLWAEYPAKDGKKAAFRSFTASVKTPEDLERIQEALRNYKFHLSQHPQKPIKNGSTWFNNWQDWVDWIEPSNPQGHRQMPEKPVAVC
jgi:hypothetical protein